MADIDKAIEVGLEHHKAGRLEQAEKLYHSVLESGPEHVTALHLLGVIAYQRGDNQLAVDLIGKAIAGNSQVPHFHNNLGVALKALGKFEEAVHACEKALLLKPDYADAYYNMGNSLESLDQHAAAVEQYRKGLLLKPADAYTYYNMGVAMQSLGRHEEAVENFDQAIQLNHNCTEVFRAMAASQKALGRYTNAISALRDALYIKPDCAQTHTDLGMILLLAGDFTQGWSEYRWRLESSSWRKYFPDTVRWDGSNFQGKRLFVRCEQGLGDNIQFVRYLPMVKERGGTTILGVYEELYSLLKGFPGVDETVNLSTGDQPLVFDLYSPIMDLPGIFGTTHETIPCEVPYIFADPGKVEYWRNRVCGPGFKVGIVWSGSSKRGGKHLRNCELGDFTAVSEIEGVKLYALQKGKGAEQIRQLAGKIPVVSLGEQFADFSDTAAAIENLDLIISVDTSVLHLAGAMGKPVWALQCFAPDWRWLLNRQDSPWYPTMRLFRQEKLGQWDAVFQAVANELRIILAEQGNRSQKTIPKKDGIKHSPYQ